VAVVSWNTRELLDACLRSLAPDAEAGLAEVWVVDNGSTDGSPDLVEREHPWARLVRSEENLGFGPAVNRVAAQSRAPWIAPANADIELMPGALGRLVAAGADGPGLGAVAPRLLLPDGSTQPSVQPFPTPSEALLRTSRLHKIVPAVGQRLYLRSHWDPERAADVPWATGAFLIVRREAFDAVRGFDEGQWMYAEDLDLAWRLHRAGWRTRYEPSAVVHHHHSAASMQAFGDELLERWQGATYAWIARRQGLRAARVVAAVNLADARLRATVAGLAARRSPARWEERRDRALLDARAHRTGLRPAAELLSTR
jgi:GT2 family glycosyltransferase